jgi:hypothetical protein
MPGLKRFAVRKLTKETDFQKIIATGTQSIRIWNIKLLGNAAYATDFKWTPKYVDRTATPMTLRGKRTKANLESGSSTYFGVDYATNTQPWEFLMDVVDSAYCYMESAAKGDYPDLSSSSALLALLALEVKQALLDLPHLQTQEDWTTPGTTLTNIIAGINWKDDDGSNDRHDLWLRRIGYVWALGAWEGKLPNLAQNIASTSAMTLNMRRLVDIMTCLIVFEFAYFIAISYVQSDFAMLQVALLAKEINKLKLPEDFGTALDPIWEQFAKPNKYATVTGLTNLTAYTADFIDDSLLEASTLDKMVDKLRNNYIVPNTALRLARSTFGIGNYQDGNHFALLLDGCTKASSGNAANHGTTQWAVGLNMACIMSFFDEMKGWNELINSAILRNQHYTFLDLKNIIGSYFTEFSFNGSVKGMCEPEVYWAARRNLAIADSTLDSSYQHTEVVRDPQAIHSTNVLLSLAEGAKYTDWVGVPIWSTIFTQGWIDDRQALIMPDFVTEKELGYDLLLGLLTNLTTSDTWQDQRLDWRRRDFIEMIDFKTSEFVNFCYSSAEQARWEYLKDPCSITDYKSIGIRYLLSLSNYGYEILDKIMQEPRPHGWTDAHIKIIDDFTAPENLRAYARLAVHADSSAAPVEKSVVPSTPVEKPEASKPSEEDEELT